MVSICALVLSAAAALAADAPEATPENAPLALIEETAAVLQEELVGKQDYYAKNSDKLYKLIDRVLLPNFDVRYAGKQVLGKTHWTSSSEAQRERFIDAFYGFLIKTYAKGILEFDQDKFAVDPEPSYAKNGKKALVRTELIIEGGDNVQVNYALRNADEGWKIYDVRIEGVSYIQNYRNQFNAEISARGIDAVIVRLETEAAAADAKNSAELQEAEAEAPAET